MFVVTEGECFVQKDGISKLEAKYSKGGFFGEGCLKAPTSHRANDPERPLRGASIVSQGGTGCLRITREAFLYAVESDKDVVKPQGGADAADVARNVHEQMERLDKGYAAREAAAGVNISQGASDRMMSRARQRTQQQPEGASENPYEIEAPPAVRPHSFPAGFRNLPAWRILTSAEQPLAWLAQVCQLRHVVAGIRDWDREAPSALLLRPLFPSSHRSLVL